jgi:hypothetical protein
VVQKDDGARIEMKRCMRACDSVRTETTNEHVAKALVAPQPAVEEKEETNDERYV